MPVVNGNSIYELTPDDNWTLIESQPGSCVYGYGTGELTALHPGEITEALTSELSMKMITNAEYSEVDDINVTINGEKKGIVWLTTQATWWNKPPQRNISN